MDGTTEPIIVVIGHPIAGNPAQFAAERALRSLKLDWRVLSFDVQPEHVAAALEGFVVTGIKGVIIDPTLALQAQQWYSESSGTDQPIIDCLTLGDDSKFTGEHQQRVWVDEQISRHGGQRLVWFGQRKEVTPASGDGFETQETTPKNISELVADADVIVISDGPETILELDTDDWPSNDGSTLVIDLTAGHPEVAAMKQLGYRVLGENERRIGTLQRCLHRWTGQYPSGEVIHDAIEEYLSV